MPLRRSPKHALALALLVVLAACTARGSSSGSAVLDKALVLDGKAWVDLGDPGSTFDIVPGGQRTFALWLRYTLPQYHAAILDKMQSEPGFAVFVEPYSTSFGFWYSSGVPIDATGYTKAGAAGTHPIGDGKWHFVAVVQRDTLVEGFVDGRLDWRADISKTLPGMANDEPLILGWNKDDVVRFTGDVDEVSIWSRALNGRELRHLMYHAPGAGNAGLEAYWPMDGGTGQTVVDRSGHGRDGVGTGVTRIASTRPRHPPWRDTISFRVLMAGLVVLVLYGLMRLYALRIERQKHRLEGKVAERVAELARAYEEKDHALELVASQAQRLEALDLARRRFFTNISHEFRTPLSLIIGPLSDLAVEHGEDWDDDLRRAVIVALRNGRRLRLLTDQLLDLARLESGALRLEASPLDLASILRDLVEGFRLGAARQRVHLDAEVPEGPCPVFGDPERLETVFANLLANAIRFSPEGGTVRLEMTTGEKSYEVRVSDEGPGIPADQADRIFDRFYQTSLGAESGGSGIGLALVRDLVELHGGDVSVVPEEGRGAVFRVALPVYTGAEAIELDGDKPRPSSTWFGIAPGEDLTEIPRIEPLPAESDRALPPLILVAEDNAELRDYVAAHLSRSYRVVEAAEGKAALALARKHLPDLVISDVMMPEMDGMTLLERLREDPDLAAVPVIFLTARGELEDRVKGLDLGADAHLTKPFASTELSARVNNLLEQRKRLRRLVEEESAHATKGAGSTDEALPVGAADGESAAFKTRLLQVMEEHVGEPGFGVSELAASVAMERTGLYRRMVNELDTTPSDFMREARLRKAARLLGEGNTVAEVAYGVGYESVSSFSRSFRERFGDTPGRYARAAGGRAAG